MLAERSAPLLTPLMQTPPFIPASDGVRPPLRQRRRLVSMPDRLRHVSPSEGAADAAGEAGHRRGNKQKSSLK